MAMSPGTRLGPYEVIGPLGAGGMGEVYRATDTNLKRAVALKVLPATLLGDANRVARLQREAETLASLNHTNVAHVYGLERSGTTTAIVMELVEGPTLADRLAVGRLPTNEALSVALQILAGLEAAHERGIVHRDLKPTNIKLAPDGTVKLLDFGIAKALDPLTSAPSQALTTPATTSAGIVLGTAAYMSPEQARGKPVDKRTDVWAFGCVLYEMLTGRAAFLGDDVTATLARVLEREPDLKPLPAGIPPPVRRTLELCLQKDPKKRLRDVGDVQLALAGELASPAAAASAPLWKRALPVVTTLVIGALLAGGYVASRGEREAPPAPTAALPVTRFVITPPADARLADLPGRDLAISPDGARVAYLGQDPEDGGVSLYVREFAGLDARPLPGTEIAAVDPLVSPLFAPDGRWIAFGAAGRGIVRVSIDGAPSIEIADVGRFLGGHWLADDTLVYSTSGVLQRVSAGSGTPEPLVAGRRIQGIAPVVLPGGRGVVFGVQGTSGEDLNVLDLDTGEQRVLVPRGQNPTYLATGHLVFVRDTTLMAVAFDASELALTGEPVALLQGIRHPGGGTAADYALSANGTLAYVPGGGESIANAAVVWVDREGRTLGRAVADVVDNPRDPRLSPDGGRLLLTRGPAYYGDLWSYDLRGHPPIRLAVTDDNRAVVWSPDGREIAFRAGSPGTANIYLLAADGGVLTPRPLRAERVEAVPRVWSAAGDLIVQTFRGGGRDISVLPVAGTDAARDVVATEYNEFDADLSPNGRWLAYVSNRSGANEIWVQPYPEGVPRRVSASGGIEPRWSADGKELFYLQGTAMMAVATATDAELSFAAPKQLFNVPYTVFAGVRAGSYDVARDGRFVMIEPQGDGPAAPATSIVVVQNWIEELKQRVPTGK